MSSALNSIMGGSTGNVQTDEGTRVFLSKEVFEVYQRTISDIMVCEYYGQNTSSSLKRAVRIGHEILNSTIQHYALEIENIDIKLLKSQVNVFFTELKRDLPEYFI